MRSHRHATHHFISFARMGPFLSHQLPQLHHMRPPLLCIRWHQASCGGWTTHLLAVRGGTSIAFHATQRALFVQPLTLCSPPSATFSAPRSAAPSAVPSAPGSAPFYARCSSDSPPPTPCSIFPPLLALLPAMPLAPILLSAPRSLCCCPSFSLCYSLCSWLGCFLHSLLRLLYPNYSLCS